MPGAGVLLGVRCGGWWVRGAGAWVVAVGRLLFVVGAGGGASGA
ncbi:hypothetical protein GA0115260_103661, partial [Streptomyces sp. MnatMP-M27]